MTWYLVGFGAIGLLTGLYTGMSESPVVATLLPLFFSLIVGTGGIYLAKADLRSESGKQRFRLIGIALTSFAAASLLASLYGISIRTGAGLFAFLPFNEGSAGKTALLPNRADISPARLMKLAIYRAELDAIGVKREEQTRLLGQFALLPETNSSFTMRQDPVEILSLTASLSSALQKALDDFSKSGGKAEPPRLVTQLHYMLQGAITILRSYIAATPEAKARNLGGFRDMVGHIHQALEDLSDDRHENDKPIDWLRLHGVPYELLANVSIVTQGNARNGDFNLEESASPEEQLFQLVQVLRSPASSSGDGAATTQKSVSQRASFKK